MMVKRGTAIFIAVSLMLALPATAQQALVFEGKIVQIERQTFPVAPALTWVDISGVMPPPEVGWSWDGASFSPPPPPPAKLPSSVTEQAEQALKSQPGLRAFVAREAATRGVSVQTVIDELKAALP